MMKRLASMGLLLACAMAVQAADRPLTCFGNEPSWRLDLIDSGTARFSTPDQPAVPFQGSEKRLDPLKEWTWRGRTGTGAGGDLVAFLREATCSDGMSDTKHPVTARVSLPDGRLLAGCCRVATASTPAPAFEGTTWRLVEPSVTGRPVTARFQAGRIDGFSGCNQFFGGYTLDGTKVSIGGLGGSMMACPDPAMALERTIQGTLAGTLAVAIVGDHLTLTPAKGTVLTFQAEPPPTLAGVTWDVTGFNNGRHAVVSPIVGTKLTLSFGDGMVQGNAGCNTYRAPYSSEGDRLTIGPAATTRMACPGEGVMQQEREFLAALETVKTWALRGGMLDVHRADGERVLTANDSTK